MDRITYSKEFQVRCMAQYLRGNGPTSIFASCLLTCVIRRPDGQGAVVDLVGICVTQDVALLALALDPLKNLMLGNELVTE